MEKAVLFSLENSHIKILMQIYFNDKEQLYFDGYDCGKIPEQAFGNSTYEYSYAIEPEEVNKFYPLFDLKYGDKSGLLRCIKKEFSTNKAYTLFGEFMLTHNIQHERFTWC